MIKYKIGHATTEVKLKQFKDGCMNVDINCGSKYVDFRHTDILVSIRFGDVNIVKYTMNDMLVALGLTVDALKTQYPCSTIGLEIPYLPYARQDRACSPGEAFSARFAAQMINGMGFAYVRCFDPHSHVLNGLYNNLYIMDQFDIFKNIYPSFSDVYIVAPDAGAAKKCEAFAKSAGAAGVLVCGKERDMKSIEITKHVMYTPIPDGVHKYLVLDDICDGGRTFVSTLQCIEESTPYFTASIDLAVTHSLFTFGVDVVASQFDKVYTTDSYISNKDAPNVKVIEFY